jgi:hypothetical protein
MTRYLPSRCCLWGALGSYALAAGFGWVAIGWPPAAIIGVFFLLLSGLLLFLRLRPVIELRQDHLMAGNRAIPWTEIRRVDRTRWRMPLVVRLTLAGDERILVIYPGDADSAHSLLRHIRRSARMALIDGRPYREFWGEAAPAIQERRQLSSPRYRLLRPEDEDEVERLYQKLRSVGRLDSRSSTDEP